jgi:SLT domain-containing protein
VPSDLPKNVSNLPPETEIPEHLREPLVIAALRLAGEAVTRANIAAVLDRVQREEDTWQTNKPNLDDSNAANGTPSIGPMQIIQPTFDEHHVPGYNDINNPLHSMAAAIRYAREVYGGIQNLIGAENY